MRSDPDSVDGPRLPPRVSCRDGFGRCLHELHRLARKTSAAVVRCGGRARCDGLFASDEGRHLKVTHCADAGRGSLRDTVAIAASGDTLNLKQLRRSALVLTSGQISIPQANLALVGRRALTVDGNHNDQVFQHSGAGTWRIESLSLANGYRVDSEIPADPVSSQQPHPHPALRASFFRRREKATTTAPLTQLDRQGRGLPNKLPV